MVFDCKKERKERGMTQAQWAKYLGIPVRNIQFWEQGVRKPPEYVAGLIMRILESEDKK